MRPLLRPSVKKGFTAERPAVAVLMDVFGPCCMLSERPLPSRAHVWHAGRGEEVTGDRTPAADWDDLFLLDANTFNALNSADEPRELLLPDRNLTFSLEDSPFVYDLEEVPTTYLDEDGEPEGDPVMEEHAVVRGTTPEAEQTVAVLALNSIYFHPQDGELRIPRNDYLSMTDHRLHERTAIWRRAEEALDLLSKAREHRGDLSLMLDQIRLTANASGYWSVWATLLWRRTEDREMVHRALFEPKEVLEAQIELLAGVAAPEFIGAGPHNAFPGTLADWLDKT